MDIDSTPSSSLSLSPSLLKRLQELRPDLEINGIVQYRRDQGKTPGYRLRVRALIPSLGYRKHLSIRLPDETTVQGVQSLIRHWRHLKRLQEWKAQAEAEAQKLRRKREKLDEREVKCSLKFLCGGKWKARERRRRAIREYNQAKQQGGEIGASLYVLSRQYLRPWEAKKPDPPILWQSTDVQAEVREKITRRHARCVEYVDYVERSGVPGFHASSVQPSA